MRLVALAQTLENLKGLGDGGLGHLDGLETTAKVSRTQHDTHTVSQGCQCLAFHARLACSLCLMSAQPARTTTALQTHAMEPRVL